MPLSIILSLDHKISITDNNNRNFFFSLHIPGLVSLFENMESAGELELDLCSIVEWGDRWLVTSNATKTMLLSFDRHRDPLWCLWR